MQNKSTNHNKYDSTLTVTGNFGSILETFLFTFPLDLKATGKEGVLWKTNSSEHPPSYKILP